MTDQSIQREILIDAPPEVVWRTITEPDQITQWFADRVELEVRPGGTGVFTFVDGDTAAEMTARLVVEAVEPPHRFSFRWGPPDGSTLTPANQVLVAFTLVAEGDARTRLRVTETDHTDLGWPDDEVDRYVDDHREGWDHHLGRLTELLGGAGVTDAVDDELWSAIGEPSRRRVLDVLVREGAASASAVSREVPFTRQAVAKHLAVLEGARLVTRQRTGREVRYQVDPDRLDEAAKAMTRIANTWDRRLAAIKRLAEASHRAATTDDR